MRDESHCGEILAANVQVHVEFGTSHDVLLGYVFTSTGMAGSGGSGEMVMVMNSALNDLVWFEIDGKTKNLTKPRKFDN
jgi:hypothetical protein